MTTEDPPHPTAVRQIAANEWAVTDQHGEPIKTGFGSNAAAWDWLDRQGRRPLWLKSKRQFRQPRHARGHYE